MTTTLEQNPTTRGTAIQLRGVSKVFGTGDTKVTAIDTVSLDLPYGELVLLVGPSGCGKTTLISIVAGLLDASAGEVSVLEHNLTRMGGNSKVRFRGANIGFVFQQYNLLPALTAVENASVPLLIAGWSRPKAIEKASDLLASVGLGSRLKSYPSQLSGGQQQRVAIARALVHEPRLLVCDEPTAALDAASGRTVMDLIRQVAVQPDRAVIVVTHDSRVYDFGDRIVSMADGKVVELLGKGQRPHE
ncbi:MAG: ABC transporter ATP-binding protein [Planctomycetia bacterium]|nr:ABC transporter ATP-binding protein [Planctomycetia bacterium]